MSGISSRGGMTLEHYKRIYDNRSDMCSYVTHLTRPCAQRLNEIISMDKTDEEKKRLINRSAVDNLIHILEEGCINGSKKYIRGPREAACFQDVPFVSLKETVRLAFEDCFADRDKNSGIRYCGVGIAFNKFFVYRKDGRPVIYEEGKFAEELLKKKEEFWRIARFELDLDQPIEDDVEPMDKDAEFSCNYEDKSKSCIIDFTYEREWRVPDRFQFDLNEDTTKEQKIIIILPDEDTYNYFLNQISDEFIHYNLIERIGRMEYLEKVEIIILDEIPS